MSKRKLISQTEARRMRAELAALKMRDKARGSRFSGDFPGGVNIARVVFSSAAQEVPTAVRTARALGHYVVATNEGGTILFYAVKP